MWYGRLQCVVQMTTRRGVTVEVIQPVLYRSVDISSSNKNPTDSAPRIRNCVRDPKGINQASKEAPKRQPHAV